MRDPNVVPLLHRRHDSAGMPGPGPPVPACPSVPPAAPDRLPASQPGRKITTSIADRGWWLAMPTALTATVSGSRPLRWSIASVASVVKPGQEDADIDSEIWRQAGNSLRSGGIVAPARMHLLSTHAQNPRTRAVRSRCMLIGFCSHRARRRRLMHALGRQGHSFRLRL
jgi:hypothetical protein